ncbi:hypothetical protein B0H10DRAFT_2223999 [Mycena sp. CBHHK59/15]|nr:hypothetical protein B0H10DRAFT_2223999 [Mycena sp. CBHHK59/15]
MFAVAVAVVAALAVVSSLVVHARLVFVYFVLPVASHRSPSPANVSVPRLSALSPDPSHPSTDLDWTTLHITASEWYFLITVHPKLFMRLIPST